MNHGYVIVKGMITEKRLDGLLREIVRDRWGSLVRIEQDGSHWEIAYGDDYSFGLAVWIESARKIEMRHQLGGVSGWLQTYNVADKLRGERERWEASRQALLDRWDRGCVNVDEILTVVRGIISQALLSPKDTDSEPKGRT